MSFEPEKFFIGLMDFFSILLPGALLTFLLIIVMGPAPVTELQKTGLPGVEWVAFLVVSYMGGHLAFLFSSVLDIPYDWLRRYTLNKQIFTLAHKGKLLWLPGRAIIRVLFKKEQDLAVNRAVKIKEQVLGPLHAENSINAFQWCKAWLTTESSESLAVVQRFEADSKFFRCFVIVLMAIVIMLVVLRESIMQRWALAAVIGVVLILLALWRYMEQRLKSTNQAYWSVITLTAANDKIKLEKGPAHETFTHAGGIVFRTWRGKTKYLLVEAKKNPGELVLPKGHIEEGESPEEAAVREVYEETGFWGRIRAGSHTTSSYIDKKGKPVNIRFFLMEDAESFFLSRLFFLLELAGWKFQSEKNREHTWLPFSAAFDKLKHLESKALLCFAKTIIEKEDGDNPVTGSEG